MELQRVWAPILCREEPSSEQRCRAGLGGCLRSSGHWAEGPVLLDSRRQRCGRNADLGAPDPPTTPWQGRGLKLLIHSTAPLPLLSLALEAILGNGVGVLGATLQETLKV